MTIGVGNGFAPPDFGGTVARLEGTFTYTQTANATLYSREGRPLIVPRGAVFVDCWLEVTTVFNAASTNTLSIGNSGDDNYFYDAAAGGTAAVLRYGDTGSVLGRMGGTPLTVDTTLTATYAQTGTAASAGAARFVLFYCIPKEQ